MAGTQPIQLSWVANIPYLAPVAEAPISSNDPMFAATYARPVVIAGRERPDRKKSSPLWTDPRTRRPI